jgi:phospholipid/cholesterol/gamma-HCH transport system substrate-binding protein
MKNDDAVDQTISQTRVSNVEFKAALLLLLMIAMIVASGAYLLYARGVFEPTQQLVLIADDSEGVTVGMDMTFSGFPIGRVRRIELGQDGSARIIVDVPRKDAHWLRESSVFTMERSLVGATRIRAFTGVFDVPPLADGAERQVLKGDAMAEIPRLVSSVRDLLDNLNRLTAEQSPLNASLQQVLIATETLNGPGGALGLLTGNEADKRRVLLVFDEAQALLNRLEAVAGRTETIIGNADQRVFGQGGLMTDTQATVREVQGLLSDARQSLQKVDAVLLEAQGIAENTRTATVDLDVLRAEVEASLRKVEGLVNDINRRWPFARDAEVRLP